jgi:hypothetical protein
LYLKKLEGLEVDKDRALVGAPAALYTLAGSAMSPVDYVVSYTQALESFFTSFESMVLNADPIKANMGAIKREYDKLNMPEATIKLGEMAKKLSPAVIPNEMESEVFGGFLGVKLAASPPDSEHIVIIATVLNYYFENGHVDEVDYKEIADKLMKLIMDEGFKRTISLIYTLSESYYPQGE